MAGTDASRKLLAHTAARVGGLQQLAAKLRISPQVLTRYLTGAEPIPESVVLKVVDVVLEDVERSK